MKKQNTVKLLFLIDSFRIGGKERRLLELLRYIERNSVLNSKVVIFKDQIEYPQVKKLKQTEVIILHRKYRKDPFVFIRLFRLCKKFKPDIIHSWGSMPSVYGAPLSFSLRIPFINGMVVKGNCDIFSKDWIRSKLTFPFSKVVLSNSKAGLKAFNAPKKRSRVIYNGFDFDRIKNLNNVEKIRKNYNIQSSIVVGMIALIQPRKDFETYLKSAIKLCNKNNDLTFLVVGDGENKEYLAQIFKHPNIIFTGNVNNVEQIINIIDIGVLLTNPSKHKEGISNSVLEFMAMGKPVIASSGGGTNEIVIPNKTGILIPPKSELELSEQLLYLINNPKIRWELGLNAKQLVKEKFSINKMCSDTIDLYKELFEDKTI